MPIISKRNRIALNFFLSMVRHKAGFLHLDRFLGVQQASITAWFRKDNPVTPSPRNLENLYYFLTRHHGYRDIGFYFWVEEYADGVNEGALETDYFDLLHARPTKFLRKYRGHLPSAIWNPDGKEDSYFSPSVLRQRFSAMLGTLDINGTAVVHLIIERVRTGQRYVDTFSPYYLSEMLTKLYAAIWTRKGDEELANELASLGKLLSDPNPEFNWYGFGPSNSNPSHTFVNWLSNEIYELRLRTW